MTVTRRLPRKNHDVVSVVHDTLRRALVCDCVSVVIGRYDLVITLEHLHGVDRGTDPLRAT